MSNPEQATVATFRLKKVLDQLQERARTWEQLRALTKFNDDNLGLTIMELLDLRKIWAAKKNDVRFYGLEKRTGLVPRFSCPQRRSTDGSRPEKKGE
jgi:hypothetical protein